MNRKTENGKVPQKRCFDQNFPRRSCRARGVEFQEGGFETRCLDVDNWSLKKSKSNADEKRKRSTFRLPSLLRIVTFLQEVNLFELELVRNTASYLHRCERRPHVQTITRIVVESIALP